MAVAVAREALSNLSVSCIIVMEESGNGFILSLAVGVKQEGKDDDGGELRPDNSWSRLGEYAPAKGLAGLENCHRGE